MDEIYYAEDGTNGQRATVYAEPMSHKLERLAHRLELDGAYGLAELCTRNALALRERGK